MKIFDKSTLLNLRRMLSPENGYTPQWMQKEDVSLLKLVYRNGFGLSGNSWAIHILPGSRAVSLDL